MLKIAFFLSVPWLVALLFVNQSLQQLLEHCQKALLSCGGMDPFPTLMCLMRTYLLMKRCQILIPTRETAEGLKNKHATIEERLLLSIQWGGWIKGASIFSSDTELVEGNGLVVTKQLVLGSRVSKHRLCYGESWRLIEGGVSSKPVALNNLGVCSHFQG